MRVSVRSRLRSTKLSIYRYMSTSGKAECRITGGQTRVCTLSVFPYNDLKLVTTVPSLLKNVKELLFVCLLS
jgi:hypothetical protein